MISHHDEDEENGIDGGGEGGEDDEEEEKWKGKGKLEPRTTSFSIVINVDEIKS